MYLICEIRDPCLNIMLCFMKNNNQINIPVKSGFITIPELRFCLITSKNETYML